MIRQILPTHALIKVLMWSLALTVYSGLAVWKEQGQFADYGDVPAGLEAAISLAIGLLLSFRANRAYERWWEGRTLWGTLVNACRNLAVKVNNLVTKRDDSVERMQQLIVAFPAALRDHLRGGASLQRLPGFADEPDHPVHVPSWIVNQIYGIFEVWKREQRIQYGEYRMVDREIKVLLEICGGCERIRNTPMASTYRVILHQALALFLLTLPWGLVNDFRWWTIPIVFLTSYFVLASEGIANHIEQPFKAKGDGLDLDRICEGIESSVNEIIQTYTPAKRAKS